MRDTIYRDEAIEAVAEDLAIVLNVSKDETRELAEHALSALPSAEPSLKAIKRQIDEHWYLDPPSAEAEWIPCSERLPDDDGDYLVWLEDESDHYAVVYFDTGADAFGWWVDHYDPITLGFIESDFCEAKNITAWQPLPTPYKGGDDE